MHTPDYSRQLKTPGMTPAAQEQLRRARVLIFGAGGLGTTAAPYLAAAGIGQLTLVDADTIEASNLHRQTPYCYADIGAGKAATLAAYCQERMADGSHCRAIDHEISGDALISALRTHDVVLDCSDSRRLAYQLNDAALITATPVVFANAAALGGQLFTLHPGDDQPCWRCLWPESVLPGGNCDALGALGPVPGIFGLYQALEALKILTGFAAPLRGEILQYDFATLRQTRLKVPRDPACNHCPDISTADTRYHGSLADAAAQQLRIIDIRSPAESAIRPLAVARDTIPMPDLLANPTRYLHPGEAVLLVCASGQRAQATADALHRVGYYAVLAYPSAW